MDAFWSDPYCENLVARGFEYENDKQANLVTAFESFEHFVRPIYEMVKILDIAPNILLNTNIISDPAPMPAEWWYYGLEHGQHIGFYRLRTLNYLANKFDLYLISDGISRHFFSKKIFLYCLAYFGLFIKQISKVIKFRNEIKNLVRSPVNLK